MGISTQEFCVTMETLGAIKMKDRLNHKHTTYVPCFTLSGIEFFHSGDGYVLTTPHISRELISETMKLFGETYPEGKNFHWHEIHTVEGLLTITTILENRYSKDLVLNLFDSIYAKIIRNSNIANDSLPHHHSAKIEKILDILAEYDSIVNPFSNPKFKMKKPSEYIEKTNMFLSSSENDSTVLRLNTATTQTEFSSSANKRKWHYSSIYRNNPIKDGEDMGYTSVDHSFKAGTNEKPSIEEVIVQYTRHDDYHDYPGDVFFKLNLKTGMISRPFHDQVPKMATEKQLNTIIHYLEHTIRRIKNEITKHMIEEETSS